MVSYLKTQFIFLVNILNYIFHFIIPTRGERLSELDAHT